MGQFVAENAHLRTDRKAYEENYERIFGKKEASTEVKTTAFKVVDGEVVEITAEESKQNTKNATAGLCGEYGTSTFDKEKYDLNFDQIKWHND